VPWHEDVCTGVIPADCATLGKLAATSLGSALVFALLVFASQRAKKYQ